MASPDDRLAVLTAILAPGSGGAPLQMLSSPGALEARERARVLSGSSRAERLHALASTLSDDAAGRSASLAAAAAAERPRVARELLALAQSWPLGPPTRRRLPALTRLLAERGSVS